MITNKNTLMMTDVADLDQPDDWVGLSPSLGQHPHHTLLSTGDFDQDCEYYDFDEQFGKFKNILPSTILILDDEGGRQKINAAIF